MCGNDRQRWFTITPPSARMTGKNSLSIVGPRNSKDYLNKEFEKTGKWVERHENWLHMRVKPDGSFNNEAFKNIADTIDDFSEQQTQGSFESVGTKDILTKALGNVEHSGRIQGQSKFVKQSQYFDIVGSSSGNAEVLDMKQQLAALERTVQELCAKHGINQETMAEEATAPTVDQHNSKENVRVTITVPKLKGALLPIPTHEATCIEEAVGGFVAWPKRSVVVQTSLSQASQGPSHAPDREAKGSKRIKKRAGRKKIQSQLEVQQQPVQQEMPSFDFSEIPVDLRPLAYYAQNSMRDGMDQRVEFISPVIVSPVQQSVDRAAYVRERADYILRTIRNAPKGKLFLIPYNSGRHWILVVIDPWEDSILYFNPLGNELGDDFKDLITIALNDWKMLVGRGIRQQRNWETLIDTVRCPIQEGYVECDYFVLAFMREITLTVDELAALQTKNFYTDNDMSLVRQEWATFVMQFIQY
ncbi:hypothetical protein TIFTF001_047144 [Ficus carica]|uniref:Ubiquitin-like protease family profile domain-containing protein n=1 Tax=Ficus carica TaxID=3494 RepID=A0AA87Z9N4_FICCA|nr:hypothetical protein TIFTF001_047131 [Ficus carica]GMN20586.1 hypothetical protein TIFTF001_047133 [Ficus carica]GMN20637.1 hypothetical protein TIFTF001_047142 [Ficus carica]GMN20655.1 hypothetical protein TIFTF001_047144 [Ficus carica]